MTTDSLTHLLEKSMTWSCGTTFETDFADSKSVSGLAETTTSSSSACTGNATPKEILTLSHLPSLLFRYVHPTGKSTILRSRVQERIFAASAIRRENRLNATLSPKLRRHRNTRTTAKRTTVPKNTLEYLPLDSPSHIRVFQLHPGSWDDPVQGNFSISKLEDAKDSYESISHAWGTSTRNELLWCETGYVAVTSSMLEMLRFLRNPVKPRSLWIDYVCINQADMEERASQVLLMPQLYGGASKVIIWLGNEDKDTSHAFDVANAAYKAVECTDLLNAPPESYKKLLANGFPDRTDKRWTSFEDMVHRLWFTRTWTVPEVSLAQEAVVMCGGHTCRWLVLESVLQTMRISGVDNIVGVNLWTAASVAFVASSVRKHRPITLLGLLVVLACKNASDARDKVYAILGLASDRLEFGASIQVSYKDDYGPDDLSLAISKSYLIRGDMGALNVARYPCLRANHRLPSWVMDFSTPQPASSLLVSLRQTRAPQECCGPCVRPQILPDDKTLRLCAIPLTTIRAVGQRFPRQAFTNPEVEAICHLEQWRYLARKAQPDVPRSVVDEIFARTLVLDTRGIDIESLGFTSFAELHQAHIDSCRRVTASLNAKNKYAVSQYYLTCIGQTCQHRTFFVLQDGRFGLGPYFARPGDVVMKVHGAETPFVFRKKTGQYMLVGEAYIHGEMDPEDCGSDRYEAIDVI